MRYLILCSVALLTAMSGAHAQAMRSDCCIAVTPRAPALGSTALADKPGAIALLDPANRYGQLYVSGGTRPAQPAGGLRLGPGSAGLTPLGRDPLLPLTMVNPAESLGLAGTMRAPERVLSLTGTLVGPGQSTLSVTLSAIER